MKQEDNCGRRGAPEWRDELVIPFEVTPEQAAHLFSMSEYLISVRVEPDLASVTKAMAIVLPTSWPQDFDPWTADIDYGCARKGEHYRPEFLQTAHARIVLQNRERIETWGLDVLKALGVCAKFGLYPLPDWLNQSFLRHCAKLDRLECSSLDAAFNHPPLTERKRQMLQEHQALMGPVLAELVRILKKNPSRAIDSEFFDEAGEELELGRTMVRAIYEEALQHGYPDLFHLRRWLRLGHKF